MTFSEGLLVAILVVQVIGLIAPAVRAYYARKTYKKEHR